MFCKECGNEVKDEDVVCDKCGASLKEEVSSEIKKEDNFFEKAKEKVNDVVAGEQAAIEGVDLGKFPLYMYIAIAISALGMLFPYYSISMFGYSESINYFSFGAIAVLLLIVLVATAGCMYLKMLKFVFGCSIASLIIFFIGTSQMPGIATAVGSYSLGYYCILLGTIAMIAISAYMTFKLAKTK